MQPEGGSARVCPGQMLKQEKTSGMAAISLLCFPIPFPAMSPASQRFLRGKKQALAELRRARGPYNEN